MTQQIDGQPGVWDAPVRGVTLQALHLNQRVGGDVNLLADVSLCMRPRELVVVVGLSGAGKTTLLDALSGHRPASDGKVLVDGVDLYANFDAFRGAIGFVPQRDIIHMDLTVYEALDYAARLRLPPGTSDVERHARIEEVLAELSLAERRNMRVRQLSGGQQKRVSIGVELITRPSLFFLDEPSSGLDPATELELMHLLRRLADQGRTVILITHSTKNLMLADRLIFLIRGGHVAWCGPPDEGLRYFASYFPAHSDPPSFDDVYALLEDPAAGTPEQWVDRFAMTEAYERYLARPLGLDGTAGEPSHPVPAQPVPPPRQASALRQLAILSGRTLKILARDRMGMALMLAAPPVLALFEIVLTYRAMFDPLRGDPERINLALTLLIFLAMAIGAMSFMREIVKETEIYRRERLVNLKIGPYVMSKVWVTALIALYQALAWFVVLYLAVNMPGGMRTAVQLFVTLFLITFVGMVLGLLASSISPTEGAAPLLTAMLIMPQVMFSGALLPLSKLDAVGVGITTIMPSRFAFEAMVTATGYGKQVARDPYWSLPKDRRPPLGALQHATPCTGRNLFTLCLFPGVRQFYQPAVDQPPPPRPGASPGIPPAGPALDGSSVSSSSVRAYELRVAAYTRRGYRYLQAVKGYERRYAAWQQQRSAAIGGAEGRIAVENDSFGSIYDVNLPLHWLALLITLGLLVGGLIGVQRWKDVR